MRYGSYSVDTKLPTPPFCSLVSAPPPAKCQGNGCLSGVSAYKEEEDDEGKEKTWWWLLVDVASKAKDNDKDDKDENA